MASKQPASRPASYDMFQAKGASSQANYSTTPSNTAKSTSASRPAQNSQMYSTNGASWASASSTGRPPTMSYASPSRPPSHGYYPPTASSTMKSTADSSYYSTTTRSQPPPSMSSATGTLQQPPITPQSDIPLRESQLKFIETRLTQVEKCLGDLCQQFGSYNRRVAKVRDKGDQISNTLSVYSANERINVTMKSALKSFAESLAGVQDYQDAEVHRIEQKVVVPLKEYGKACKEAKKRMKQAITAKNRELKEKKKLDNVKFRNPSDAQKISRAQTSLQKASVDASWVNQALENEMDNFERKKLVDTKIILAEFVNIEMIFHARALQQLSECAQCLRTIDENEDLEEFRKSLHLPNSQARLEYGGGGGGGYAPIIPPPAAYANPPSSAYTSSGSAAIQTSTGTKPRTGSSYPSGSPAGGAGQPQTRMYEDTEESSDDYDDEDQ